MAWMSDSYHSRTELSATQLCCFLEDRIAFWHYYVKKDWPLPEPTEAMQFGTLVHEMIERGEGPPDYLEIPEGVLGKGGRRAGPAWKDFRNQHVGKILLKTGEPKPPLSIIWQHLMAHPKTFQWITQTSRKEEVIFWRHEPSGIACRSKLDLILLRFIVDWKTASSIMPWGFQKAIWDMRYYVKLAFYQMAYASLGESRSWQPCIAVAIKNKPGYGIWPYEIDANWLATGRDVVNAAMDDLAAFDVTEEYTREITTIYEPQGFARRAAEFQV
jgi:hypothetical protein